MPDYIYQVHGPYRHNGAKQIWTPEQVDCDLESVLEAIEQDCEDKQTLARVVKIDGDTITDATDEVYALLHARELERHTERFHQGAHRYGHDFRSLDGYLEMQDWNFPAKREPVEQAA